MNELFPILGGFISGMYAGGMPLRARFSVAALLGSVVALAATLVSGEYRISWGYVLVDAVLAIGCAVCTTALLTFLRSRSGQHSDRHRRVNSL